jgi:NADH-quinone oxidoreductase subunit G
MGKFILDGQEIEFKPGQTIIEAAKEVGIDIPHFCWHPSLTVAGNCRVCLVEVERMPKLAIACATQAGEGMVVHTESNKALSARQAVMEFLLINHPLDCPICDEAGECKLQDYTYSHSIGESRFTEEKQHKEKRVPLGPNVMFDGDRCISCSRCIRFCDEVAGKNELTFVKRGDRVTIQTFPGKELDNPYSLCVTDICPVGALTNRDFRFKARVWDMSSTASICPGCSRGCNVDVWARSNQILRLTPRQNDEVNSYWMCDNGRLNSWKNVNSESRIDGPYIKRDSGLSKSAWDEIYSKASTELHSSNSHEIAFIGSGRTTVEDNYILAKLATHLHCKNLDFPRHSVLGSGDNILIRDEKSPNDNGALLAGVKPVKGGLNFEEIIKAIYENKIKTLVVVEEDIVAMGEYYANALKKLDHLIVIATNFNGTTELAQIVIPAPTWAEKNGVFVNFQGRAQRIRPAIVTEQMDRSLDGLSLSRLDKFGTKYDRWGNYKKYDARPTWQILLELGHLLGLKTKFDMAEDVWEDFTKHSPDFHGISYDELGELGLKVKKRIT